MLKNRNITNKFNLLLENLKLANKFNLLLILVFICGVLISGTFLSNLLEQRAKEEVTSNAEILIQTMRSVRNYTTNEIIPLLAPKQETTSVFIPQTVAAFSARKVFEDLRKNKKYEDFIYKEAALDPTNLLDKADSFETNLIQRFSKNPNSPEISDFLDLPGGKTLYIARPLTLDNPSCLQCHSTPDRAPKTQLASYGDKNGFNWQLHKTIFAQLIYVPADKVFASAHQFWWFVMSILIAIFAIIIIIINFLLKKTVIKPITQMSKIAQAVSTGKANSDFDQKSNDEIGTLAASFNRMKSSLEIAMRLIAQKNQNN
ncbi:MAG: DUF3365 domain-containing protein [Rhizonema sp. PD37]|nr:DUF3365 domain-containing protein [Rhizonema sp. PD37]